MSYLKALGSGIIGSLTLTLINETVRQFAPKAPRLDVLGERAVDKSMLALGQSIPSRSKIYPLALASDLISNSLYYSISGTGKDKNVWLKGALMGLTAGIGAVALPGPMGLGQHPTGKSLQTKVLTIAWYVAGGLATAAAARYLNGKHD
jgi:hypothetical protein